MRNILEKLIVRWMSEDKNVIFLAADIGGGLYKNLKNAFYERVINVGIAEQNMIGMASGLTEQGFRVICYSKACFISLRVVDQIKNALCYPGRSVVLIAADAGYDESNAGAPHTALEDLGVISALAGIDIFIPTTEYGLNASFNSMIESDRPSYLRMNKEKVSESICDIFPIAEGCYYLRRMENSKIVFLVNGCTAIKAMKQEIGDIIAVDSLQCDWNIVLNSLMHYDEIVIWEEQFESNGLYALLCRLFVEKKLVGKELGRIGPQKKYNSTCFERPDADRLELELYRGC